MDTGGPAVQTAGGRAARLYLLRVSAAVLTAPVARR